MSTGQDEGRRQRRRRRSIAFFDHGHGEHSADERKTRNVKRRNVPKSKWRTYLRVVKSLLRAILIYFAVITVAGLLLRGAGFVCRHTPKAPEVCSSPWITSQQPLLLTLPPGETPTTRVLQELSKLNDISPSLQALSLVMGSASASASEAFIELYESSDKFRVTEDELEHLVVVGEQAGDMLEQFAREEYDFRQASVLWDVNGINQFGISVGLVQERLNDTQPLALAVIEHGLHRLPYGAAWGLSRHALDHYLGFLQEQEEVAKDMVIQATETGFILGYLFGVLGQLERKLGRVLEEKVRICRNKVSQEDEQPEDTICFLRSPELRAASKMRAAVQWCQDVVETAEKHYKTLFSELTRTTEALRAELKAYRSQWPSKSVLSLQKLNETLATERAQLDSYVLTSVEAESMTNEILGGLGEEEDKIAVPQKLVDAIAKREVRWWP